MEKLEALPVPRLTERAAPFADLGARAKTAMKVTDHSKLCTERGVLSVARFCYVFPCELREPAWAVGSYRVGLVVWQQGWVDLDLECSTILLGQ